MTEALLLDTKNVEEQFAECNNLPEAPRVALNPLLYFLSPVNRVVARVWSQISYSISPHRRVTLLSEWLRELLRPQSKDLMRQNKNRVAVTRIKAAE